MGLKKYKKRSPSTPTLVGQSIFLILEKLGGSPELAKMHELEQNWQEIMGDEVSGIARPAGAHNDTLLLTVEDAIDMQEIRMSTAQILEKANSFLKKEYFIKIKISLAREKHS